MAGSLLDECYSDIKRQVTDHLSSVKTVCIISDAWTNVVGEPVVNYMATSPTKTFFIESVATHDQSHSAQWIADDMARIIDSLACDVAGAVTDNTNANRAAWKILEEKYPGKFFHGCVSHALHLLVKDIFGESRR